MDDWEPNEHLQDFDEPFTTSEPECEAKYLMRVGDLATLDADVVAGRVVYDDETTQDCLDDNAAQSCFEWFDYPGSAGAPHCDGAFVGKVALGEACQLSLECVAGFCEGVCKVFP